MGDNFLAGMGDSTAQIASWPPGYLRSPSTLRSTTYESIRKQPCELFLGPGLPAYPPPACALRLPKTKNTHHTGARAEPLDRRTSAVHLIHTHVQLLVLSSAKLDCRGSARRRHGSVLPDYYSMYVRRPPFPRLPSFSSLENV